MEAGLETIVKIYPEEQILVASPCGAGFTFDS